VRPLTDVSDLEAKIAAAKDGDVRAFESVIAGHLPQVRRFARAFAPTESDADDLAQEALVKVYRSLASFRFQSAFSTWVYSVVRNAFLDFAKSRAARERLAQEPLEMEHERIEGGASPDEGISAEHERRRLWRALRQIPAEFRSAIVLFEIEGHSCEEVASIERVAVGTVKSRLSRGRALLREALGGAEEAIPLRRGAPGTGRAETSSHSRSGS